VSSASTVCGEPPTRRGKGRDASEGRREDACGRVLVVHWGLAASLLPRRGHHTGAPFPGGKLLGGAD
jgi:hypothetical protein